MIRPPAQGACKREEAGQWGLRDGVAHGSAKDIGNRERDSRLPKWWLEKTDSAKDFDAWQNCISI